MKVWLDDVRPMPKGFDVHAKTAAEAITLLESGLVQFISLDHDLCEEHYPVAIREMSGEDVGGNDAYPLPATGYDVACWIETAVRTGRIKMPGWSLHIANPPGRDRMRAAMQAAERVAKA